jgi:hypothetical protein
MAKNKLAKKRKHKRDVAEKRRARAFYRMREQDRQDAGGFTPRASTWEDYVARIVVLTALAGIVTTVYHTVKAIIK